MAKVKGGKPTLDKAELRKHGWVEVADGKVEGWEPGKVVVGRMVRVKDGKFGPLLILDDGDDVRTIGLPTILATKVEGFREGDMLYIECTGKQLTSNGRDAWSFEVLVKRAAQEAKGQETLPF